MIKFFRKIRYDLMKKNKTGKYLKYAIGEILLVIIGILIAVSINNWNEERKLKKAEQSILKDLKQEMTINLKALEFVIEGNERSFQGAEEIKALLQRNKLRLYQELSQSKEAMYLIKKSSKTKLNEDEKE